jgi:hypothetical protein
MRDLDVGDRPDPEDLALAISVIDHPQERRRRMGQAFDRDGHVLGEATGDTKREVFDQLHAAHQDAAEIRIKSALPPDAPPPDPLMQFFRYEHLPPNLGAVSKPFGELATLIINTLPRNPERTVALRKLLESKDCAVRAVLFV